MTKLIIEEFKDIDDIDKQVCKGDLHAWNNPKIIMSKENIEKFKDILKSYEIEFDEKNLKFDCIIGPIPIIEEELE